MLDPPQCTHNVSHCSKGGTRAGGSVRDWLSRGALLGLVFRCWFEFVAQDHRHWMYPADEPRVVVEGSDPAQILIIGDAPAAGFGVRTHGLGIAGHLARRLSLLSARGVTVTIKAQPKASARSAVPAIEGVLHEDYDAIVLMLTTTDALCLTSIHRSRSVD